MLFFQPVWHDDNTWHRTRNHIQLTPAAIQLTVTRLHYGGVEGNRHIVMACDEFVVDAASIMLVWCIIPVITIPIFQLVPAQIKSDDITLAFKVYDFHFQLAPSQLPSFPACQILDRSSLFACFQLVFLFFYIYIIL